MTQTTTKEKSMSKYGEINVDLSKHFTTKQLQAFADANGISYDEAESLAKELVYRKIYAKLRNKDPQVKAKRKAYNQKRTALLKMLR